MVDRVEILSAGEHTDVLGIFTTDGENHTLGQKPGLFIPVKDPDAVVSGV